MNKENKMFQKMRNDPLADKEKGNKKKWAIRITALIIILLLVILGLHKCGYLGGEQNADYIIGTGVKEGQLDRNKGTVRKKSEIESNRSSSMRVKLNGYPVFLDGNSAGSLEIENPAENVLYMKAVITLDDTGEVIYESGAIPPNHYIEDDKLAKVLEKGEYHAIAHITLFDPENADAQYNSAKFNLIISIKN
ncbi:MAG: hypothetical protein ACRDBO_18230 [Lachnospiraceae bacterium]